MVQEMCIEPLIRNSLSGHILSDNYLKIKTNEGKEVFRLFIDFINGTEEERRSIIIRLKERLNEEYMDSELYYRMIDEVVLAEKREDVYEWISESIVNYDAFLQNNFLADANNTLASVIGHLLKIMINT
ncbi:MAG: hypothetical protein QXK74_08440 [Candidatus Nitrosocaldaceae archaeon]